MISREFRLLLSFATKLLRTCCTSAKAAKKVVGSDAVALHSAVADLRAASSINDLPAVTYLPDADVYCMSVGNSHKLIFSSRARPENQDVETWFNIERIKILAVESAHE